MTWSLFFILSLSLRSFAGPLVVPTPDCETSSLYQNSNFFPPEMADSFSALAKLQPALNASFGFSFGTNPDGSPYGCSGTYTSHSGHFSTALHCLRNCLIETGHLKLVGRTKMVRTEKKFPAMCTVQTSHGPLSMKILAAGECYAERKADCSGENDFIIGQVEGEKTTCEKMRSRPPKQGEKIVAIGVASGNVEGREYKPDGIRPHFALGEVLGEQESDCYEAITLPNGKTELRKKVIQDRADGGMGGRRHIDIDNKMYGLVRMSADASFGSSGGTVIDASGEAIGIITNGGKCIGQNYFLPITQILDKAKEQMTAQDFAKVMSCR